MKYYIATDHAGFKVKNFVKKLLENRGFEVIDLGPNNSDRVDYPDYAKKVCEKVSNNKDSFGVLICGTGIGMSIAANKINGIRAGLVQDPWTASMAKAHNNANILCFGERVVGEGMIKAIIDAWCDTEFEEGRHLNRVKKIMEIEKC